MHQRKILRQLHNLIKRKNNNPLAIINNANHP